MTSYTRNAKRKKPRESEKLKKLHEEALVAFDRIQDVQRDERLQAIEDRRFYSIAGAQWEGALSEQYKNKPRLEINKVHLSVIRIINEYRNNRVSVDFVSKDGTDDQFAETCDGLYRADELDSNAEEAYDNAFEEAIGGGIGAWRLRACYEDEYDDENDKQRIKIEPIYDADATVFFDQNAKRQDKRDAKCCYVLIAMDRESYADMYDDDPDTWPQSISGRTQFDWATPDVVYVAEYYKIEDESTELVYFETIDGEELKLYADDLSDEVWDQFGAAGTVERRRRDVKRRRVHKYVLGGGGVLEDCGCIAGTEIPVVPVYGKRWYIDNIERFMGHVRLTKDSQRLINMLMSKLAEISSLSSTEKPIFTPDQMAGHEVTWSEDNIKNYPYQLINPLKDENGNMTAVGPVGYTKPPQIPPAHAALLQLAQVDMQELTGKQEQAEEIAPNVSGKAIELVQNRLDQQTFIYISNFAKAMRRCGEIWLAMARELYVEEGRKMKVITEEKEVDSVTINAPGRSEEGQEEYKNDLSAAKFDVAVDVGPSSKNRKEATVRSLIGLMQMSQDPQTIQMLASFALMNMEGEGIGDLRKYYRKQLVRQGVLMPTEKESAELQKEQEGQQPSPQDQLAMAAAQAESARAQKAQADALLSMAKAEEVDVNMVATLAGIDQKDREIAMKASEQIRDRRAEEKSDEEESENVNG